MWDKGAPLDEHVLRYTAGEDYALDERLVRYDVRASIAHAQMLHAQKLLSAEDLALIEAGLSWLAEEHERGQWRVELARAASDRAHRTRRRARAFGPLAQ